MTTTDRRQYIGTALPEAAEAVILYTTHPQSPEQFKGNIWYVLALRADQDGTLNFYRRQTADGERALITTEAFTGGEDETVREVYIEPYAYIEVEFVNGATPQTVFDVNQCLSRQRASAMLG